jgi:hypothetical protein
MLADSSTKVSVPRRIHLTELLKSTVNILLEHIEWENSHTSSDRSTETDPVVTNWKERLEQLSNEILSPVAGNGGILNQVGAVFSAPGPVLVRPRAARTGRASEKANCTSASINRG